MTPLLQRQPSTLLQWLVHWFNGSPLHPEEPLDDSVICQAHLLHSLSFSAWPREPACKTERGSPHSRHRRPSMSSRECTANVARLFSFPAKKMQEICHSQKTVGCRDLPFFFVTCFCHSLDCQIIAFSFQNSSLRVPYFCCAVQLKCPWLFPMGYMTLDKQKITAIGSEFFQAVPAWVKCTGCTWAWGEKGGPWEPKEGPPKFPGVIHFLIPPVLMGDTWGAL